MSALANFIVQHIERGECHCGKCIDVGTKPDPTGPHAINLVFFWAKLINNPDPAALIELVQNHQGEFNEVKMFDGNEHSFLEVGGWVGDQGLALLLMGLGAKLGLWNLLTPYNILGPDIGDDVAIQLAGAGYITVKSVNDPINKPVQVNVNPDIIKVRETKLHGTQIH